MKHNRVLWAVVICLFTTAMVVTFGPSEIIEGTLQPMVDAQDEAGVYPIVDFQLNRPSLSAEDEFRRVRKAKPYEKQDFVFRNPHPDDSGVGRYDHSPSTALPTNESVLIVIGEITNPRAQLSTDYTGVFSEFDVKVSDVIKGEDVKQADRVITVDRAGGTVRYPNGQQVKYFIQGRGLPKAGVTYLLFLAADKESPNYHIVRAYELQERSYVSLDFGIPIGEIGGKTKSDLLKSLHQKLRATK